MPMKSVDYVAAGGVIIRDGQMLLLDRPRRGEIRLPKGHVDPGETHDETALRESAEETGYADLEIVEDLGERGSLMITRPVLSHYMSTRSEIDAAAKSLFDAVGRGVVSSSVVKTFPLREAAAAHEFIGARKTTGSVVMLPFE